MSLPYVKTNDANFNTLQTQWLSQLNPLLANPMLNGVILKGVVLASGSNTITHNLKKPVTGWLIVRNRASATFYDTQDSNTSSTTLLLTASGATTVDILIF